MAEQKATVTFTNPYLFNGKELDEERRSAKTEAH
jgi:hypothetical protein